MAKKYVLSIFVSLAMILTNFLSMECVNATDINDNEYSITSLIKRTSSDYGYHDMQKRSNPEGRQLFYNKLMESMSIFMYDDTIDAYALPNIYIGDIYIAGAYILENYGLTFNEASEVYEMFRNDNPIFYFASGTMYAYPVEDQTYIIIATDEEFSKAADRKKYNEEIKNYIESYSSCVNSNSLYESAKAIHDKLILSMQDAIFENDEKILASPKISNIIGAIEGFGNTIAYSKSYSMLCNYYNIENIFVKGESSYSKSKDGYTYSINGNAWNIIKLDDGKYYNVDCCIDDISDEIIYSSYDNFAVGSLIFDENHISNKPDGEGVEFLYDLPVVSKYRYQTGDLGKLIEKTSINYGYRAMETLSNSEGRKKFYNHIMDDMIRLWDDNDIDFDAISTNNGINYIRNIFITENFGLSANEASEVYLIFKNDNPIFYFMSNEIHILGNEYITAFCLNIYEDFALGSVRKKYNDYIYDFIESFSPYVNGVSKYEDAKAIHDRLILSMEYAHNEDGITPLTNGKTQSIIGGIEGLGVCDSYTRTYQMLCNYYGIENIYVSGRTHSWNIIKLDDGKYYNVDCTWDDLGVNRVSYDYFSVGTNKFYTNHTPDPVDGDTYNFLYALPEISCLDYQHTFVKGDANGDGNMTIADIVLLQNYLVKKVAEINGNADMNDDGKLDVFDVVLMRRMFSE